MIFIDDSTIKVSGVVLPGLIKSIEIKDDALVEEQEIKGSSKKAKQALGYEDAKVTIELILDDSENITKKEKIEKLQNLFKKSGQEKPVVHELINEHTASRRIKKVIFKSLSTKEDNKRDQIIASLEFWSYDTISITATNTTNNSSTSSSTYLDPAYQSYLSDNRGQAPKTDNTPAIDNATTLVHSNRLLSMPF